MRLTNPKTLLLTIPLLVFLVFSSCIKLDPSPLDTYQGEMLGWLAIAATPDRVDRNPQVRYKNTATVVVTISLSLDTCTTSYPGTIATSLAALTGTSSYYTVPAGTYWIKSSGCTATCSSSSNGVKTFTFSVNNTYTVTAETCSAIYSVASP